MKIETLFEKYQTVANELFKTEIFQEKATDLLQQHFSHIRHFTQDVFTLWEEKNILAQGELLSTALMHLHLLESNHNYVLLPALNFMRIDKNGEPDEFYIKENINRELQKYPNTKLFITQGDICRDAFGEVDNLKRGGSDYSASLIGAAVSAREIQIWTDIDGFHNNDPHFVKGTKPIRELSFDEAAELAYFGAKIMHPSSIQPAQKQGIPVRLKNTVKPESEGTLIRETDIPGQIKAVAAKDNITAVKIKSSRMLMAYGFIRKIFEVFERYRTPIDMITTSEIAVSVSIDDTTFLPDIISELKNYGVVEIDENQSIICVVGNIKADEQGIALRIFKALETVPIRMISYGGSRLNISVLVKQTDKIEALNLLSKYLLQ